jgi:hypothetical protein
MSVRSKSRSRSPVINPDDTEEIDISDDELINQSQSGSQSLTTTRPNTPFHFTIDQAKIINKIRGNAEVENLTKKQLDSLLVASREGKINREYFKLIDKDEDFQHVFVAESLEITGL